MALNDAGQTKEALQVLAAALKRDPYDRDVLSGLAFFTAQAGKREVALGYVTQLRELDPENRSTCRWRSRSGAPRRARNASDLKSGRRLELDQLLRPQRLRDGDADARRLGGVGKRERRRPALADDVDEGLRFVQEGIGEPLVERRRALVAHAVRVARSRRG